MAHAVAAMSLADGVTPTPIAQVGSYATMSNSPRRRGTPGVDLARDGLFGPTAVSLAQILRRGACTLLAQAIEAEVVDFLASHTDPKIKDGRQRIARHG
jgi:hypothetical protein